MKKEDLLKELEAANLLYWLNENTEMGEQIEKTICVLERLYCKYFEGNINDIELVDLRKSTYAKSRIILEIQEMR